jgi:DNA repair protein RadD
MIKLRDYQKEAKNSINKFFENGYGNPLVVAPTGAGKSVIMGQYIIDCVKTYPQTRIMCLAHVKELLEQNYEAIKSIDFGIDVGLFSASLNRKDRFNSVIVAGIQSVYDKADDFGFQDMLVIDECHLINPKQLGRYRDFIEGLKCKNPNLKIVGFTATPYRLGHGWIHKGEATIFNGIAYDIPVEMLIKEGYLVRPSAKAGKVHADLTNVHIVRGDFKESEAAEAFEKITLPAVKDIIERTSNQKCGLIFCSGLKHAESVKVAFESFGVYSVDVVSGKTHKAERARMVSAVKEGRLRWLINVAVFTTGFDAPNIDTIVFLRATQSTSLYVQMIGRGLRIPDKSIGRLPSTQERLLAIASSVKPNCLVLDYGENVQRHGPLNYLRIKEPGQKVDRDEIRAKACPSCEDLVPVNARECPLCGFVFPIDHRNPNHATTAAEIDLILEKDAEWFDVESMTTRKHCGPSKKPSMKVTYTMVNGLQVFEWICLDHGGYATTKAVHWCQARGREWMSVDDAIKVDWPVPTSIKIKRTSTKFFEVMAIKWKDEGGE